MRNSFRFSRCLGAVWMAGFVSIVGLDARPWSVDGAGWLTDRKLSREVQVLFGRETALAGADVEDIAVVLLSRIHESGYLDGKVLAKVTTSSGERLELEWQRPSEVFVPRDVDVARVDYELQPGVRFFYYALEVKGSSILDYEGVKGFFFRDPLPFQGRSAMVFTPGRFAQGQAQLLAWLQEAGYPDAKVEGAVQEMIHANGRVSVMVSVEEGALRKVGKVVLEGSLVAPEKLEEQAAQFVGQPLSRHLRQELVLKIRNTLFGLGYPQAQVRLLQGGGAEPLDGAIRVSVDAGDQYRVGEIRFVGHQSSKGSWLRSHLTIHPGDLLNPVELDRTRMALSGKGHFARVEVSTEPSSDAEGVRDLVFELEERYPWALDFFVGWGSYERQRGGFVLERRHLWGRGHRASLKGVVSTKSSYGELNYLVPDFYIKDLSLSGGVKALTREEPSFDHREAGVQAGVSKWIPDAALNVDLLYTFQDLEVSNSRLGENREYVDDRTTSGSLELRVTRDRRDSPVNPTTGFRWYANVEWASDLFGGEAKYQRFEAGVSWHREMASGLLIHAALNQASVVSVDGDEEIIPVGKLLFPGGENSIRGYGRGEASLRDVEGKFVGSRANLLLNLELEQLLTDSLSAVVFVDTLAASRLASDGLGDETLSSIGLGVRWRTFMGPVRLEYGHNLNRRPGDPNGALHFAIGFPF